MPQINFARGNRASNCIKWFKPLRTEEMPLVRHIRNTSCVFKPGEKPKGNQPCCGEPLPPPPPPPRPPMFQKPSKRRVVNKYWRPLKFEGELFIVPGLPCLSCGVFSMKPGPWSPWVLCSAGFFVEDRSRCAEGQLRAFRTGEFGWSSDFRIPL